MLFAVSPPRVHSQLLGLVFAAALGACAGVAKHGPVVAAPRTSAAAHVRAPVLKPEQRPPREGPFTGACLSEDAPARAAEIACILHATHSHALFAELGLREALLARIDDETDQTAPAAFDGARACGERALDPDVLQGVFERALQQELEGVDLSGVRAFLASPLGRRYGAVGSDDGREDAEAWLRDAQPSAERLARFDALLEAGRYAEVLSIVVGGSARLWSEAGAKAGDRAFDEARFLEGQATVLPSLVEHAKQELRFGMRAFSDAELDTLIAHERSEGARAWTDAMLSALQTTVQAAYSTALSDALVVGMQATRAAYTAEPD